MKVLIAYIPIVHAGYLQLIENERPDLVYLVPGELAASLDTRLEYLRHRDALRALNAADIRTMLEAILRIGTHTSVLIASEQLLRGAGEHWYHLVLPDDDVSDALQKKFQWPERLVTRRSIYLRWDWRSVLREEHAQSVADVTVSAESADVLFMRKARAVGDKSADWWRQVGALLVSKKRAPISVAYNRHVPDEQMPYAVGDPRSLFDKGEMIELSSAIHAEATLIARAACSGIALLGSSLYVSTFPCPPCAKLIAEAGITRLAFSGGYSKLDGAAVLKAAGVELVYVDVSSSV